MPSYNRPSGPSTTPNLGLRTPIRTGQINVALAVEQAILIYLPPLANWLGIFGLIFGGCCSNVSSERRQHLGGLVLM